VQIVSVIDGSASLALAVGDPIAFLARVVVVDGSEGVALAVGIADQHIEIGANGKLTCVSEPILRGGSVSLHFRLLSLKHCDLEGWAGLPNERDIVGKVPGGFSSDAVACCKAHPVEGARRVYAAVWHVWPIRQQQLQARHHSTTSLHSKEGSNRWCTCHEGRRGRAMPRLPCQYEGRAKRGEVGSTGQGVGQLTLY